MKIVPVVALGLLLSVQAGTSFVSTNTGINLATNFHRSKAYCMCDRGYAHPSKTERWQDLAEFLINPLKSPLEKPAVLQKLFSRTNDIAESVNGVLSGKVELEDGILSSDAKYQLDALRSVRRQLVEDIIPDSRRSLQNWVASGFPGISPQDIQKKILERLDDITSSGSLPPPPEPADVVKSILEESKNLFLSTPELETPDYKVVEIRDGYEIRDYPAFAVCRKTMNSRPGSFGSSDGEAFTTLAEYLFGKNSNDEAMAMTTPVITARDAPPAAGQPRAAGGEGGGELSMAFVLPSKYSGRPLSELPRPADPSVSVDVSPPVRVAARGFAGFATDGEVARQLEALGAALARDGLSAGRAGRQLLQYNPPWTLPTVRRNEVLIPLAAPSPPPPPPDGPARSADPAV